MSEAESAALPEPTTDVAKKLRKRVPAARWGKIVAVAVDRAKLLDEVAAMERESGLSKRRSLEAVAPEVDWSTYLHIRRKHAAGKGPSWERLLDGRIPPEPFRVPVEVRKAACMLRRAVPGMSYEAANAQLVKSFGETGRISDSSLGRIWRQAGLVNQLPREGFPEKIVEYNGGAGLAFLGAADLETGVSLKMAGKRSPSVKLSPHARVASQRLLFTGQQRRGRLVAHVGLQSIGEKLQDITVLQL